MKLTSKITAFDNPKRANGFTLIELLVVIAIIAILAALLLPALVSVKNRSQMVTDINNNKQIMLGEIMYANNSDDFMTQPGWDMTVKNWGANGTVNTAPDLMQLGPNGGGTVNNYNALYADDNSPQKRAFRKGQLYPYLQSPAILLCPADVVNANYYLRQQYLTSYVMNGGVVQYGHSGGKTKKLNAPELRGTYILLWENDESKTQYGQWNDFSNYPDEGISARHGEGAMIATLGGSAFRMDLHDFVNMAGNAANPKGGYNAADYNTAVPAGPNELWWYSPN